MMKVMLAAIEIFSLVYQRIFAQKVLTQRKHSRVWECFVWGMYFVISNFFTYSFAKSAWDNTGIFVVSFFFALRILYIDSAWVLSAVTAFMAISGALSEVLTYYGWQIFVQKSGVKVDTANEDYLLLLVSKLVMFFFIKILLALIKRHKNIRLNTQEYYKGQRKEKYFTHDLKQEHTKVDKETGEMIVIPSREDSYERLLEAEKQFAEKTEKVEDVAVRAVMLE